MGASQSTSIPPVPFIKEHLDLYDNILFDLDGVVWDQYRFLPITLATLDTLRAQNKRVFFCTNNSSAYHEDMVAYFSKNNYTVTMPSLADPSTPQQIYSAGMASAKYVKKYFKDNHFDLSIDKIVLCGEEGLRKEFLHAGFTAENVLDVNVLAQTITDKMGLVTFKLDPTVKAVVLGFNRSYDYVRSAILTMYIHELQIPLVSTNPDTSFSVPGGRILPEFGGFVKQIEATCNVTAIVSCGKPNTTLFEQIKEDYKLDLKRTLMVGDNLLTDIQFGINCGIDTLLVLSGVTQADVIRETDDNKVIEKLNTSAHAASVWIKSSGINPTYIASDISAMIGGVMSEKTEGIKDHQKNIDLEQEINKNLGLESHPDRIVEEQAQAAEETPIIEDNVEIVK